MCGREDSTSTLLRAQPSAVRLPLPPLPCGFQYRDRDLRSRSTGFYPRGRFCRERRAVVIRRRRTTARVRVRPALPPTPSSVPRAQHDHVSAPITNSTAGTAVAVSSARPSAPRIRWLLPPPKAFRDFAALPAAKGRDDSKSRPQRGRIRSQSVIKHDQLQHLHCRLRPPPSRRPSADQLTGTPSVTTGYSFEARCTRLVEFLLLFFLPRSSPIGPPVLPPPIFPI